VTVVATRKGSAQTTSLLIAATTSQMDRAGTLARALPELVGPGATAVVRALDAAASGELPGPCPVVVLLLGDRDAPAGLTGLLDAAEAARIPVLMLIGDGGRRRAAIEEVAVERLDASDDTVAACIRGMLARQREVERLGRELALATRFTDGLRGEISRMQEELQLAAHVQREFLPRGMQPVGEVRVEAFWRPASYVSGDIYDVMRIDEQHIGVFVADAVGHGVPAALLTMVICRALPAKDTAGRTYRIVPPAEALARINADLIGHRGRTTRFATAVYAVVNCVTGHVRLASAGHPAPLVMRAHGESELPSTGGGLLGVFDGEQYPEIELHLAPGDRLLMYTDGFEQAFPGDPTGSRRARLPSKRYIEEFEALASAGSPAEMVRQLGRRVDMQFGSLQQADDLTLIVVERLRNGAESGA
jgi:phosphoserine phosphatase RsbU/P